MTINGLIKDFLENTNLYTVSRHSRVCVPVDLSSVIVRLQPWESEFSYTNVITFSSI